MLPFVASVLAGAILAWLYFAILSLPADADEKWLEKNISSGVVAAAAVTILWVMTIALDINNALENYLWAISRYGGHPALLNKSTAAIATVLIGFTLGSLVGKWSYDLRTLLIYGPDGGAEWKRHKRFGWAVFSTLFAVSVFFITPPTMGALLSRFKNLTLGDISVELLDPGDLRSDVPPFDPGFGGDGGGQQQAGRPGRASRRSDAYGEVEAAVEATELLARVRANYILFDDTKRFTFSSLDGAAIENAEGGRPSILILRERGSDPVYVALRHYIVPILECLTGEGLMPRGKRARAYARALRSVLMDGRRPHPPLSRADTFENSDLASLLSEVLSATAEMSGERIGAAPCYWLAHGVAKMRDPDRLFYTLSRTEQVTRAVRTWLEFSDEMKRQQLADFLEEQERAVKRALSSFRHAHSIWSVSTLAALDYMLQGDPIAGLARMEQWETAVLARSDAAIQEMGDHENVMLFASLSNSIAIQLLGFDGRRETKVALLRRYENAVWLLENTLGESIERIAARYGADSAGCPSGRYLARAAAHGFAQMNNLTFVVSQSPWLWDIPSLHDPSRTLFELAEIYSELIAGLDLTCIYNAIGRQQFDPQIVSAHFADTVLEFELQRLAFQRATSPSTRRQDQERFKRLWRATIGTIRNTIATSQTQVMLASGLGWTSRAADPEWKFAEPAEGMLARLRHLERRLNLQLSKLDPAHLD